MRSLDEILGPIMIGPSSSHTAGACRIGRIMKSIVNEDIKEVCFYLHGSFGKTYRGHGTDRALVGGILGMDTDDERIINSFDLAEKYKINITFKELDLGMYHPNTVKGEIKTLSGKLFSVIASSIGGGNIEVLNINGNKVYFTGKYNTLLINHIDKPGVVHRVSGVLSKNNINIAYLKVFRNIKGDEANMVFELDCDISRDVIEEIKGICDVCDCTFIESIS